MYVYVYHYYPSQNPNDYDCCPVPKPFLKIKGRDLWKLSLASDIIPDDEENELYFWNGPKNMYQAINILDDLDFQVKKRRCLDTSMEEYIFWRPNL